MATQLNYIDLILFNGDRIIVTYKDKIMDQFLDEFRNMQRLGGYWNIDNWPDASASLNGIHLSEINMSQVVGIG